MRRPMIVCSLVCSFVCSITLLCSPTWAALNDELKATPGDFKRTLNVGELERWYRVHIPKKYDGKTPMPVVLVFHGGGGNPESMIRLTGMNTKADSAGFIAVYPAGTGRFSRMLTFNGGNCCGHSLKNDIDDVQFTRAMLDDLKSWASIDTKRIFATGLSNGGIISYYLAARLSDRIAAIAPVGGPMGTETCDPKYPVSVMHFHGTDDAFAPFKGGKGKGRSGTEFYSVEHSIENWVQANRCNTPPMVETLDQVVDDGTKVIRKTYGAGSQGSEVVLIEIRGGGHTWPGAKQQPRFLGTVTGNINANDAMWEFFKRHPRP